MSKIQQLIQELKGYQCEKTNKSTLHICRLMENNRQYFLDKMDATDFNFLHSNFENLSNSNPKEYNTLNYQRDYEKIFESLLFHLNKIL